MTFVSQARLGRMVAMTLAGIAGFVLAALFIAWSGVFNVAASRGHWAIVDWFLAFGMRNSVETRALTVTVPPLDDPDLVELGAAHFHGGCPYCHGAPGTPISPVARHMLPPPPDLSGATGDWKDRELLWIIKHGIKYTGMPSWVACMPCHGPGALASYPRLAGQQARYMAGQLRLWKGGLLTSSDGAAIMAPIAARLSEQQLEDVSAYLAALPRECQVRPQ